MAGFELLVKHLYENRTQGFLTLLYIGLVFGTTALARASPLVHETCGEPHPSPSGRLRKRTMVMAKVGSVLSLCGHCAEHIYGLPFCSHYHPVS